MGNGNERGRKHRKDVSDSEERTGQHKKGRNKDKTEEKKQKGYWRGVVGKLGVQHVTPSGKRSSFVSNHQSNIVLYLPSFTQTLHSLLVGETLKTNPVHLQQSVICNRTNRQISDILLSYFLPLRLVFRFISTALLWKRQLNSKMSHHIFRS